MTTHFTSGVTNVAGTSTLGKLKMPAPAKYHVYHNDFDTYLAPDRDWETKRILFTF